MFSIFCSLCASLTGSSWFNRLTVKTRTECVGQDKKQIKVISKRSGCNAICKIYALIFTCSLFCPRCFHLKVYTSAKVSTSPVCVSGWKRKKERERECERAKVPANAMSIAELSLKIVSLWCVKAFDSLLFITYNPVDQHYMYSVYMSINICIHMYI